MSKQNNIISMLALFVAFGFAGAYVNGEMIRNKELKEELAEIRLKKEEIEERVKLINQRTLEEEKVILKKINTAFQLLGSLNTAKALKQKEIDKIKAQIDENQRDIENSIAVINAQSKAGFIFTPVEEEDSTKTEVETP